MNAKIKEANARRKEDGATTKRGLKKIEERVSVKLTDVSMKLQDYDKGLILLHEG